MLLLRTIPLLLVGSLLYPTTCVAVEKKEAPTVLAEESIVLSGVIERGNIVPAGASLLRYAASGRKDVNLIISSPGGEVLTGGLFLVQMKTAQGMGLNIRCFVPDVAASMAFNILLQCNERYTLDSALHLWHRIRVALPPFTAMTGPQLDTLAKQLLAADQMILRVLYSKLHMPHEDILYHFDNETLHTGEGLESLDPLFIRSYSYIPGLLQVLNDESVPHFGGAKGGFLLGHNGDNKVDRNKALCTFLGVCDDGK